MTEENTPTSSPLRALLEASANSPLVEADPKSLDELAKRAERIFNIRPLDLTDDDIATAVAYYTTKKERFIQLAKLKEAADANKKRRGARNTTVEEELAMQAAKLEI